MRHYSVVVDAYLTARAKTESVTGVHNDGLIGAMVAHKKRDTGLDNFKERLNL